MSEERTKLLGQMFYSPADMTDLALRYAETVAKQEKMLWGIERLDRVITPLMPGHVATILGRPGNGKSTLLGWYARRIARQCKENEIVVHLTHEQAVEQADFMFWANEAITTTDLTRGEVPAEVLRAMAPERAALPVWVLGESIIMKYAKSLRFTAENVYEALRLMARNYGVKIKLVTIDYLQIQPIEAQRMGRVEQVTEAIIGSREVARGLGCPVMMGAQAARSADSGGAEQLPAINEAQWASAIEQASDEIFGLWRPITTRRDKGFSWKGQNIITSPWHLLFRCLKDRWGAGTGETFLLHCEPHKLILTDTEEMEL